MSEKNVKQWNQQNMTYDKNIDFDHLSKIAVKNCEPLYLSKPFLRDGHTSQKANGTITYVKYQNITYGITCAHVYNLQHGKSGDFEKILTVWGDRLIYQFGGYNQKGYVSSFRLLENKIGNDYLDIAVIRLNDPFNIHMAKKDKIAINLDSWEEPNWELIKTCIASGFPTELKEENQHQVSAKLLQVIAELTSKIDPTRNSFLLASTIEDNKYFFSGMSGGTVSCITHDDCSNEYSLQLIGFVYEGSPGSSLEWEKRDSQSFLTTNDIQVKAYTLTPSVFNAWLKALDFI